MKYCLSFFMLSFLTAIILLSFPGVPFAQAPNLRTAGNFVLFTTTGAVANTGTSNITGNIGTNNGAISGFDGMLSVTTYNADVVTAQCSQDLLLTYDQLSGAAQTIFPAHAPVLGNGEVLTAGVYLVPAAGSVEGILTLDAEGNSNAVFIFKILGAFSPGPSSQISLIRGALPSNVFWLVEGGAIAMAALSSMKGVFVAHPGAIHMAAGGSIEGRLLSTTGAITIDGSGAQAPDIVLPVDLLDFKATKADDDIEILWTTANEFSLARFEVERSADGRNFSKIGSRPATNTSFVKTYTWMDNAALDIRNIYRLKMVDIDGVFKYSGAIKIEMNAKKSIGIYPNPVTDHILLLQMYGQLKGVHTINMYNTKGENVISRSIAHDGNNAVQSISLDKNLQAGMYYLEISDPENHKNTLKVLIK